MTSKDILDCLNDLVTKGFRQLSLIIGGKEIGGYTLYNLPKRRVYMEGGDRYRSYSLATIENMKQIDDGEPCNVVMLDTLESGEAKKTFTVGDLYDVLNTGMEDRTTAVVSTITSVVDVSSYTITYCKDSQDERSKPRAELLKFREDKVILICDMLDKIDPPTKLGPTAIVTMLNEMDFVEDKDLLSFLAIYFPIEEEKKEEEKKKKEKTKRLESVVCARLDSVRDQVKSLYEDKELRRDLSDEQFIDLIAETINANK